MLCFGNDAPCLYLTTISSMANFLSTLLYSEFIFSSPKVNGARVSAMFPGYGCTSQSFVWDWHSLPIDASTNHTTHKPIVPYLINGTPFVTTREYHIIVGRSIVMVLMGCCRPMESSTVAWMIFPLFVPQRLSIRCLDYFPDQ